jgi:hypothetical protein
MFHVKHIRIKIYKLFLYCFTWNIYLSGLLDTTRQCQIHTKTIEEIIKKGKVGDRVLPGRAGSVSRPPELSSQMY